MTGTTISIHTVEQDPDEAIDALKRAIALIDDLRAIEGLRVIVTGDLMVSATYEVPKSDEGVAASGEGT
jgi:hypothetical protein